MIRDPSSRLVLSKAKPQALWRLAKWLGQKEKECHCNPCVHTLMEWLTREMIKETNEKSKLGGLLQTKNERSLFTPFIH